jgi:hypothetical protein
MLLVGLILMAMASSACVVHGTRLTPRFSTRTPPMFAPTGDPEPDPSHERNRFHVMVRGEF